jgi:endonuclease/exonuclease/phosphatase family metal-dependent hydrolase
MLRLATEDDPEVLCLQEVPLWAVDRLAEWSGMTAYADVAAPARLGPLPSTPRLGCAITSLNHGLFRSAFTGQANAILVAPSLRRVSRHVCVLNGPGFRRRQARWLGLPLVARLAWAKERRICQAVRLIVPDGPAVVVANLHATKYRPDERLSDAEVLRAAVFADALAQPADVCVLAGDLNVRAGRSWTLEELSKPEWGFAAAAPHGVDHVLVRGGVAGPSFRWPDARRRIGGVLLSDHPPVEARIG